MRSEAQQAHTDGLAQERREKLQASIQDVAAKRAASQARAAAQKAYERRLIAVARDTQLRLRAEAAARREGRAA